uniref:SAC3/GANP/THP3 conserved domain-containing protein n=1 Tax=Ananas comosus var. bracteatus TaxID=296719 RepID=A0A6V7Q9T8_ANACO|nr:unnamed protein product [Ananas comosus var. bracteatus]
MAFESFRTSPAPRPRGSSEALSRVRERRHRRLLFFPGDDFPPPFSSPSPADTSKPLPSPERTAIDTPNLANHERISPATTFVAGQHVETKLVSYTDVWLANDVETSKRMRSPATTFNSNQLIPNLNLTREAQKPDVTLRNLDNQKQSPIGSHSLPHQKFHTFEPSSDTHNKATLSPPKPVYTNAAKRARSPPLLVPEALQKPLVQLDSDREELAKAKRLARFNVELSRPIEKMGDFSKQKTSSYRQNHASLAEHNALEPAEEANRSSVSDIEVSESSPVVVGLCPDMCPESEREERERKGDLDRYERLDGERNQTTKNLAVKKYTRTAERETSLIRPLPVLQITVDYLLNLLDQPYDDSFLSIYNFLWDRMRAVRLDLRMQHIFNQEAITMLEQMIRLHIIAMHELCEYNKGEGFSEGLMLTSTLSR